VEFGLEIKTIDSLLGFGRMEKKLIPPHPPLIKGGVGGDLRRDILGVLDFFKGGRQGVRGELEPLISKETRSYDELIDEIMEWNIDHTDILDVLRSEIEEERLAAWSRALEVGVRKGLASPSGKMEESPLFPDFLDLYKFVIKLRPKLLMNPTMNRVKKMEKSDSLCVCIICGIRALQMESGTKRLLNTLHWILLERYLGN
jgi:hypothetical protein